MDVTSARPAIVFLHGMWASPEDSCGVFERGATRFGFLVCPRGNAPLGDGRMWAGTAADAERQMRAALAAAEAMAPGKMDRNRGTLIGYSNGA
jgi:predicted esterase